MRNLRAMLSNGAAVAATAAAITLPAVASAQAGQDTSSTSARNQNQSGYTDTKTGQSTLGPKVKKTSPTSGHPVMAKGDTLRGAEDSSAKAASKKRRMHARDSTGMGGQRDTTPQ
jgi:hypothetical protein